MKTIRQLLPRRLLLPVSALLVALAPGQAAEPDLSPQGTFEALPWDLQAKVNGADHPVAESLGLVPFYILTRLKTWEPGQTLRIAFFGGSPDLHRKIAAIASTWTQYANLRLDFGYNPATQTYRTMGPGVSAEIRISFNRPGYWSLVGRDSIDPVIIAPDAASMNFARFADHPPGDAEFRRVVLHEFGHALGLQHEHQSPAGGCDAEFDWPKVTAYLMGPPNNWSQAQVDFNLRQLRNSSAYDVSVPDRASIMFYHFEPWMFIKGTVSPCCVANNTVLSVADQQGIATAYPANPNVMNRLLGEQLTQTLQRSSLSNPTLTRLLRQKLQSLKKQDK